MHLKVHTPHIVHFSKFFHRGCMDFKWSCPLVCSDIMAHSQTGIAKFKWVVFSYCCRRADHGHQGGAAWQQAHHLYQKPKRKIQYSYEENVDSNSGRIWGWNPNLNFLLYYWTKGTTECIIFKKNCQLWTCQPVSKLLWDFGPKLCSWSMNHLK